MLSDLPVDLFIKQITYLFFDTVVSVCQINKQSYKYCTKYDAHWKKLIDDTFSSVDGYNDKLNKIWTNLELLKVVIIQYNHALKLF